MRWSYFTQVSGFSERRDYFSAHENIFLAFVFLKKNPGIFFLGEIHFNCNKLHLIIHPYTLPFLLMKALVFCELYCILSQLYLHAAFDSCQPFQNATNNLPAFSCSL